jgi:hypothetical protein
LQYKVYSLDVKGCLRMQIDNVPRRGKPRLSAAALAALVFLAAGAAPRAALPAAQAGAQAAASAAVPAAAAPRILAPRILAMPASAAPGDPFLCWLQSDRPILEATARILGPGGTRLSKAAGFFMPSEGEGYLYGFLLALPVAAPPGPASLAISAALAAGEGCASDAEALPDESSAVVELGAPFTIEAKTFVREDIPLDKANTALRTEPDPAKTAESLAFAKIFQARDPTALFALGPMTKPLTVAWRETATFADERRYLYFGGGADSIRHGGVDIGAKEGSPVLACAPGRVVFAARRIVTGNTIVLEHLPGLFSIYMHLSALAAREGEVVAQGQKIGLVGSTGLSTGPHLHWELRVGETSVNPAYWLERSLFDRSLFERSLLDKSGATGKIEAPAKGR